MTLPRLMISSVLKLFPSIFKYSFVFDFEFFCLNFLYLNRLLGSSTVVFFVFCDLDWGWGGRGLLSFIWALWLCVAMGNMDGEMDSEGNACIQTLPDTNPVSVLLNYGIIFPLSLTTSVWKGLGGGGGGWGT